MAENIATYARIRPPNPAIKEDKRLTARCEGESKIINQNGGNHDTYKFTKVFDIGDKNQKLFETAVKPLLDNRILQGISSIFIVYGQSGSGKSYTLIGEDKRLGVLPMSLQYLLSKEHVQRIHISSIEAYGKKTTKIGFYDLVSQLSIKQKNAKKFDPYSCKDKAGLSSSNAQMIEITNSNCLTIIEQLQSVSHMAPTLKNPNSSRGHTVYFVRVQMKELEDVYFIAVDLAGSEGGSALGTQDEFVNGLKLAMSKGKLKLKKEQMKWLEKMYKTRFLEAGCINNGLIQVQTIFSELKKQKISRAQGLGLRNILSSFISLECSYAILFTLSASANNNDATRSTLRFAKQTQLVKVHTQKAKKKKDTKGIIAKLQKLVKKLRNELAEKNEIIKNLQQQINVQRKTKNVTFNETENKVFEVEYDTDEEVILDVKVNSLQRQISDAEEEESKWTISRQKSVAFLSTSANSMSEKDMKGIFDEFDENENGTLDATELQNALKALGMDASREQAENFISEGDSNGDGEIDYNEFKIMIAQTTFTNAFESKLIRSTTQMIENMDILTDDDEDEDEDDDSKQKDLNKIQIALNNFNGIKEKLYGKKETRNNMNEDQLLLMQLMFLMTEGNTIKESIQAINNKTNKKDIQHGNNNSKSKSTKHKHTPLYADKNQSTKSIVSTLMALGAKLSNHQFCELAATNTRSVESAVQWILRKIWTTKQKPLITPTITQSTTWETSEKHSNVNANYNVNVHVDDIKNTIEDYSASNDGIKLDNQNEPAQSLLVDVQSVKTAPPDKQNAQVVDQDDDSTESNVQITPKSEQKSEEHKKPFTEKDISIYKNSFKQLGISCDSGAEDVITSCLSLQRLSYCLYRFQERDPVNNVKHRDKFVRFCQEMYINDLLDDCAHLFSTHQHQLEKIRMSLLQEYKLKDCSIAACRSTHRHFNNQIDNNNSANKKRDGHFEFYKQVVDSIHCFIFHLFDLGFRYQPNIQEKDQTNSNNKMVTVKKYDEMFNRFKSGNTNIDKYTIKVGAINQMYTDENDDSMTFTDTIIVNISKEGIPPSSVAALLMFFDDEEYDTDCIEADINESEQKKQSNIYENIKDPKVILSIKQFLQRIQTFQSSFSTGITFYYWETYKPDSEETSKIRLEQQYQANINDHSGYSAFDLYVDSQKYKNMKEEFLSYGQYYAKDQYKYSMNTYMEQVVLKCNKFEKTKKVKSIEANWRDKDLRYGIKFCTQITKKHIQAIILYCDFSELSADFSATFRAIYLDESIESIKTRNQNYYHLSKTLREAVQIFGTLGSKEDPEEGHFGESGPFYTGMSFECVIPSFNIRLCGPTSTSKDKEVAMRFTKENRGIIIQFNTNGDTDTYINIRFFNCEWISAFPEERERLFFGGESTIKIQSVIKISTKANYAQFFRAVYWLDLMVTGAEPLDCNEKKKKKKKKITRDIKLLKGLIKVELGLNKFGDDEKQSDDDSDDYVDYQQNISEQKVSHQFDDYILQTFKLFCKSKKTIVINVPCLHRIQKQSEEMSGFIMHDIKERSWHLIKHGSYTNLFKKRIFNLFKNLEKLVIYSTDGSKNDFHSQYPFTRKNPNDGKYPFALSSLWPLIDSTQLKQVIIKDSSKWWLHNEWQRSESQLDTNKFEVEWLKTATSDQGYTERSAEQCLIIHCK